MPGASGARRYGPALDELDAVSIASTQLCHGPVTAAGYTTLYTVPAGKRTIVKSIVARNTNAAANRLQFGVKVGAVLYVNYSLYAAAINASGDSINFQPWIVMNAGDLLQFATPANGFDVLVSGAELIVS